MFSLGESLARQAVGGTDIAVALQMPVRRESRSLLRDKSGNCDRSALQLSGGDQKRCSFGASVFRRYHQAQRDRGSVIRHGNQVGSVAPEFFSNSTLYGAVDAKENCCESRRNSQCRKR